MTGGVIVHDVLVEGRSEKGERVMGMPDVALNGQHVFGACRGIGRHGRKWEQGRGHTVHEGSPRLVCSWIVLVILRDIFAFWCGPDIPQTKRIDNYVFEP